ncbi:nucleotidyltransferase domain-containing protein [Campylobacter jejuni]|nr:nucleotidyltransferase [Campylobacter jejuni]
MSVNSYLENLAKEAIVRDNEKTKIQTSIRTIKERLENYFGSELESVFLFGSYRRNTIISRKFDDNSDVDIMVVFKTNGYQLYKPETYINKLKDFMKQKYFQSEIYRDYPTAVLELNHIKFELVPAIKNYTIDYQIPCKDVYRDWMNTNPNDLDGALVNNQTLRRLVRIAKIWNARQDYIYKSYELEKWIVNNRFYGNLSDYFYQFCELLPINWNLSENKQNKIQRLKVFAQNTKCSDNEIYLQGLFE